MIACRDVDGARRRFGVENATGIIYTRIRGFRATKGLCLKSFLR
jgi:hypothetical protein